MNTFVKVEFNVNTGYQIIMLLIFDDLLSAVIVAMLDVVSKVIWLMSLLVM